MSDHYSEFVNVNGTNIQVFAMKFDDEKKTWSIGAENNGIGIRINDTTENPVQSLKELRKTIDGAIKFLNDKQGKINDEPKI